MELIYRRSLQAFLVIICLGALSSNLYAQYIINTAAGGGVGDTGPAVNASLQTPKGMCTDAMGNIYIADYDQHRVRKIEAATGRIYSIAGTGIAGFSGDGGLATEAQLNNPVAVALDAVGNVYITDQKNQRIRKIDAATGIITSIAGGGASGYQGNGGLATDACFYYPKDIVVDNAGNIYVCDGGTDSYIRKIDASTGIITAYAGGTSYVFKEGMPALNLNMGIYQMAVDINGDVLFAESRQNRIFKVDSAGRLVTIVGENGKIIKTSLIRSPYGFAIDVQGNFYIASGRDIFKTIRSTGAVQHIAGNGQQGIAGNGDSASHAAITLSRLAVNSESLFLSVDEYSCIRKINNATNIITLAAGNRRSEYSGDGGLANSAGIINPYWMGTGKNNDIYIPDFNYYCVRKVDGKTGIINVIAGNGISGIGGDGGPALKANFSGLKDVCADTSGNVYLVDGNAIRRIDAATQIITTVAGNIISKGYTGDGALAVNALLNWPSNICTDEQGNVYIADASNSAIRKIDVTTGIITTVTNAFSPGFMTVDKNGNLYVNIGNKIVEIFKNGTVKNIAGTGSNGNTLDGEPAATSSFYGISGIGVDQNGDVYFGEQTYRRIRKVSAVTGLVKTIAGLNLGNPFKEGMPALDFTFTFINDISVKPSGEIYVVNDVVSLIPADRILKLTAPYSVNIINRMPACGKGNGFVAADVNNGTAPFSFKWSTGDTIPVLNHLGPGIYTVTVTDQTGSIITASIVLQDVYPHINLSPNSPPCHKESTGSIYTASSGNFPPFTYNWSTGSTLNYITNVRAGSYSVTITDNAGCTTSEGALLTESDTLVTGFTVKNISCNGNTDGEALLLATGGKMPYKYQWADGKKDSLRTGLASGNFIVTITDARYCSHTENISITQPEKLDGSFLDIKEVTCNGSNDGSVHLSVTGGVKPYKYVWSDGGTDSVRTALSADTLHVLITDSLLCSTSKQIIITQPEKIKAYFSIGDVTAAYKGYIYVSATDGAPPYTFKWSNDSTTDYIYDLKVGNYKVTITDNNNCQVIDSAEVKYSTATSINTATAKNEGFTIYPNPVGEILNISATNAELLKTITSIELYDIMGEKVLETKAHSNIDVGNLPKGFYFLKINTSLKKSYTIEKLLIR